MVDARIAEVLVEGEGVGLRIDARHAAHAAGGQVGEEVEVRAAAEDDDEQRCVVVERERGCGGVSAARG